MGIDLILLPVEVDHETWGFAHTILDLGRPYTLFDEIKGLHSIERPDFSIKSYVSRVPDGSLKGECCYGKVIETPYGEPLTYIKRTELIEAMEKCGSELNNPTKAAHAYLKCVSCEWVALYWY